MGKRSILNGDDTFNLAFTYSDIIKSDEFKKIDDVSRKKTLVLKAMNGITTSLAEFDIVCKYLNATDDEKNKWFKAAIEHTTKELKSVYTNKSTKIQTELGMREKNGRKSIPTIDDLF